MADLNKIALEIKLDPLQRGYSRMSEKSLTESLNKKDRSVVRRFILSYDPLTFPDSGIVFSNAVFLVSRLEELNITEAHVGDIMEVRKYNGK